MLNKEKCKGKITQGSKENKEGFFFLKKYIFPI